jgi:FkbM family methyltransferase
MLDNLNKLLWNYERGLVSRLGKKYYYWACEIAKNRIRKLQIENVKIKLDFNSLNILTNLNDRSLYINPYDEGISADLYAWGIREPLNTYTLFKFITEKRRNIDAILDIGSNIGYFPLIELASGAKEVIAVEPVPETYTFLKRNLNRFKNSTTLNAAIADKTGKIKMYIPPQLNLATVKQEAVSFFTKHSRIKVIEVNSFSLEDIIRSYDLKDKNVLIRMDVEGFEETILKSIPDEIYSISFELHDHILGYERTLALINELHKIGYRIEIVVKDLMGYIPAIKLLGIKRALHLYEKTTNDTRILYEPNLELIKKLIKRGNGPHIFTTKQ